MVSLHVVEYFSSCTNCVAYITNIHVYKISSQIRERKRDNGSWQRYGQELNGDVEQVLTNIEECSSCQYQSHMHVSKYFSLCLLRIASAHVYSEAFITVDTVVPKSIPQWSSPRLLKYNLYTGIRKGRRKQHLLKRSALRSASINSFLRTTVNSKLTTLVPASRELMATETKI